MKTSQSMTARTPWTVARFSFGTWTTGGKPNDADYAECEVWQIPAASREEAIKAAQRICTAANSKAKRRLKGYGPNTACIAYESEDGVEKFWHIAADPTKDDRHSLRLHLAKHMPGTKFLGFAVQ